MNSDAGGWLWLLIDVGFVVILAITLVYGIYMWRTRSRKQPASAFVTKRHENLPQPEWIGLNCSFWRPERH
jgi:hypothetical protein